MSDLEKIIETTQDIMKKFQALGYSDQVIVNAINKWIPQRERDSWYPIDRKTYSTYRRTGIKKPGKGIMLYKFFTQGPDEYRASRIGFISNTYELDDREFVAAMMDRVRAPENGCAYNDIESVLGRFEMYRRSWQVMDGKHFVRSSLEIIFENGIYKLSEFQKFSVGKKKVDETDEGYIMPYKSDFFGIANSPFCMKFYNFYEMYPSPAKDISVQIIKGNLMAIAGKGENPSYRFYASKTDLDVDHGHYNVSEFSDDEDMKIIFDYIFG